MQNNWKFFILRGLKHTQQGVIQQLTALLHNIKVQQTRNNSTTTTPRHIKGNRSRDISGQESNEKSFAAPINFNRKRTPSNSISFPGYHSSTPTASLSVFQAMQAHCLWLDFAALTVKH